MTEVFMSLICANKICRTYGEECSLKDISFMIEEKDTYGFLGKRGSGKSSLAKILAGASDIDSGELTYRDAEMYSSQKQDALLKKRIGYVPDKPLFDADVTVFETLDLAGRARAVDPDKRFRQIKEALELTGLTLKSDTLTVELQLHEKKRLSVAASLLGNPEFIILDEPFRYLDARQTAEMKRLIAMLKGRKTVLIFSSRPDDIEETCSYTAIMSGGELVLWHRTEELIRSLKDSQLGGLGDALEAFSEKEAE